MSNGGKWENDVAAINGEEGTLCSNCAQPIGACTLCARCEALEEMIASTRRALKSLGHDKPLEQYAPGLVAGMEAMRADALKAMAELSERKAAADRAKRPQHPKIRRSVNHGLRVDRGAIRSEERTVRTRRETLSHSWVFWIPGGEKSRVLRRGDSMLIGYVYLMAEVPSRVFAVNLEGGITSHRAAFLAVRMLEKRSDMSGMTTKSIPSEDYRLRKLAWEESQRAIRSSADEQ